MSLLLGDLSTKGSMSGTYKRFKNTKCIVKYLEVTDEQYEKAKELIQKFEAEKRIYKFNVMGLIGVPFHKKIQGEHSYYCAEFVKYILEEAEVVKLPQIIKPDDFNQLNNTKVVYKGLLRQYAI